MKEIVKTGACRGIALFTSLAMASTMLVGLPVTTRVQPADAAEDAQDAQAADLEIGTRAEFQAFRDAVNAGDTFAGKTIVLTDDLALNRVAWEPIGTSEHPFCGSFDGQGYSITGLNVTGSHDLGLFGWVGVGGSISNLSIENGDDANDKSTVTATASSEMIRNVGSVAGYVYGAVGEDEFAILNCRSEATVTVESTMTPTSKTAVQLGPEGEAVGSDKGSAAQGYTQSGSTIARVGGVVGYSAGSVSKARFSGALSVTTHKLPIDSDHLVMATAIGGVVGQIGGYAYTATVKNKEKPLVHTAYPQADGSYKDGTSENVALLASCRNSGTITTTVDGDGGEDRFGQALSATLESVGGVAGYVVSDVKGCTNAGLVDAQTGSGTGGVVGCVRGIPYTGNTSTLYDGGTELAAVVDGTTTTFKKVADGPMLTVKDCVNKATVNGRSQVGGVVGQLGTRTSVKLCANLSNGEKGQRIAGYRWNKPTVGGIVGQTYGNITSCYNRVDVATNTGGGYYVAGIVGMTSNYSTDDEEAWTSDRPEVMGCYCTGSILASGDYKQAGIVGENDGYVQDCYFVKGSSTYTDSGSTKELDRVVADDYGTIVDATVKAISASEMKSKNFPALLNASVSVDGYEGGAYFVMDLSGNDELNDGYPVFAEDRSLASSKVAELSASALVAVGTGSATYTAANNPVPQLSVKYNGTELVQGTDYYVIPDTAVLGSNGVCRNIYDDGTSSYIKEGETFAARIVGIGAYTSAADGVSGFTAAYTIAKGNFADCTVSIASKTYNCLPQYPDKDADVKIYDAAGNVVDGSQWSMAADPGTCINYKRTYASQSYDKHAHEGYQIEFTANEKSNYEGTTYGFFKISKANILVWGDSTCTGFKWNGRMLWYWNDPGPKSSTRFGYAYMKTSSGKKDKNISVVYCGEAIKPTVVGMKVLDGNGKYQSMKLGTDYRVVYGDPGRDDLVSEDNDTNTNVAKSTAKAGTRPCVTVRFIPGDTKNFTNYVNIFFTIKKADISKKSQVTVKIPSSAKKSQLKKSLVKLKGYTGKTLKAKNYSVKFGKVTGGKCKVTVKGKKNLKGTYTKTITVK